MDTRETNIAWWIAGVLLVLLIIVGYLWLTEKQDLGTVLSNGGNAIAAEKAQMQKDCVNPQSLACKQDLSDLESTLQEFKDNLQNAQLPATTTASGSAAVQ
jgi:hypothetical protein